MRPTRRCRSADDHALSVGLFTYRGGAHFGFYADPGALPDARELPSAMNASLLALGPRNCGPCDARPQGCVMTAATSASCARAVSEFSLCERSKTDSSFPKYPRVPVRECRGHEPREPSG